MSTSGRDAAGGMSENTAQARAFLIDVERMTTGTALFEDRFATVRIRRSRRHRKRRKDRQRQGERNLSHRITSSVISALNCLRAHV